MNNEQIEAELVWSERANEYVAIEDVTDYILEDDRDRVNKYIESLQKCIRGLRCTIARLDGQVETWEKSWRIWNGEEH